MLHSNALMLGFLTHNKDYKFNIVIWPDEMFVCVLLQKYKHPTTAVLKKLVFILFFKSTN